MAQYADFEFYQNKYYGEALTAENADRWLSRASDELDVLTFGRLIFAFPTVEAYAEKVKKAACAVAEALFFIDVQRKAVSAHQTEDGEYRGAVSSISSGKESIAFSVNGSAASAYAAAASDESKRNALIIEVAARYLANVPDANGTNLLYAGGDPYVCRHGYFV